MIDKPGGWTSHAVVGRARRLLGTRRVGHAGTLDPMATGVLVLGVNRATRLLGHLALTAKSYAATIRLGLSTVSDDADGEVTERVGAAGVSDEAIETALAGLRGELQQVPSAVSAIKVDGVRSYARVRAGTPVELRARPVRVDRFVATAVTRTAVGDLPVVDCDVEVDCSSGTYVRALARDLGAALGCGGHLTRLRRTRVGPFSLAEAQALDIEAASLRVLPMGDIARRCFPTLTLDDEQVRAVRHGRRLADLRLAASPAAVLDADGRFLALYRAAGSDAVAEAVFAADRG